MKRVLYACLATLIFMWAFSPAILAAPASGANVTVSGTIGDGGAPWRLYSDGTMIVEAGAIQLDGRTFTWNAEHGADNFRFSDIHRIIFTGPISAGPSLQRLFAWMHNLTSIEGLEHFDTSNVTNMHLMFSTALAGSGEDYMPSSLVNLQGISGWDTSNVTDMSGVFTNASQLTSLDLSGWDTSNVTDMQSMFSITRSLTNLNISGWDTSNVTNMRSMFRFTNLESLNLSSWDTSNVTSMDFMFANTPRLTSLDISGFDTSNVLTSVELMGTYDGTTMGHTWVWQPIPHPSVLVNGVELAFDQPPVIQEGRTLVPLRVIFEALGANVDWDPSTQTVTSVKDDVTISLRIGSNVLVRNDAEIQLDVPAQIVGERTLVPVRAVAEGFGAEVDWDSNTRTVTIAE